jgi:hypothetical protein
MMTVRLRTFYLLLSLARTADALHHADIAVFGNADTKALVKAWVPKPVPIAPAEQAAASSDAKTENGAYATSGMLPHSKENLRRAVRARILLETDPSTGCFAANIDGKLVLMLSKFSPAEHQVLLPLWASGVEHQRAFKSLAEWHAERLSHRPLSGTSLVYDDDIADWKQAFQP